jgi:hypothetical protein
MTNRLNDPVTGDGYSKRGPGAQLAVSKADTK